MPPAIPVATYRLQLTANFDFDAAAAIVPYLKALGITHLYASPFMKARKGSTHGYDIVDHAQFNPELGGEAGFQRLSAALQRHDLGLILDFVPNHVGVHFADNPWWLDTLEWGEASPHAVSFDIDWELLPYRARGGVLLPIIGSSYGEALEKGEIELRYDAERRQLFRLVFRTSAADRTRALQRDIAHGRAGSRRRTQPGGPAHPCAGVALQGTAPSQSQGGARLQGRVESHRGQRGDHRARAQGLSGRTRSRRPDPCAASSAGTPALQARPLAARLQRHQLSPLLRCEYPRRAAGRGCRHVRRHPSPGQDAGRGRPVAGAAARPHRWLARSRAIFPAAAPHDPRGPGQTPPSRFTW